MIQYFPKNTYDSKLFQRQLNLNDNLIGEKK